MLSARVKLTNFAKVIHWVPADTARSVSVICYEPGADRMAPQVQYSGLTQTATGAAAVQLPPQLDGVKGIRPSSPLVADLFDARGLMVSIPKRPLACSSRPIGGYLAEQRGHVL